MSLSEYKMFSRAAQDVGIKDKDERKLIAMDPNMLLDEASPEFKKQIGPKTLQGFFEFLNNNKPDNDKETVRLGNILYQYRSDERAEKNFAAQNERQPRALNEQDQKIINLGCRLIEDSFYSGKLSHLNDKSSAAAAFVFNNLAKIFQSQKNLEGFDKEKFDTFIKEVSQFENDKLFEKYTDPEAVDKKKNGQDNLDKAISQESSSLEEFIKQDWDKCCSELNDKLRESLKILQRINYLRYNDTFQEKVAKIFRAWPDIIGCTNDYAKKLLTNKNINDFYPGPLDNQFRNSIASLASLQSKLDGIFETSFLEDELALVRRKIKTSAPAKTKKYNDLSTFGLDASKDLAPDAVKVLEEVFENNGQGLFNQYILQIKKVDNLKEQRERIISQDKNFQSSCNKMLQKHDSLSTIPYFLKSYIIASDLRNTKSDRGESLKHLAGLAPNKTDEHLFFGEYEYDGENYTKNGPNYANVHYLPGDMPLAIWAVEYLESPERKNTGKV